jgi:hypothetical protein
VFSVFGKMTVINASFELRMLHIECKWITRMCTLPSKRCSKSVVTKMAKIRNFDFRSDIFDVQTLHTIIIIFFQKSGKGTTIMLQFNPSRTNKIPF